MRDVDSVGLVCLYTKQEKPCCRDPIYRIFPILRLIGEEGPGLLCKSVPFVSGMHTQPKSVLKFVPQDRARAIASAG
jgi:hypothetical protein